VIAVAPWLVVSFGFGILAAILGGVLGGIVAAAVGVTAQTVLIPAWVPATSALDSAGWQIDLVVAIAALVAGLWIRSLILAPRPAAKTMLPSRRSTGGRTAGSAGVPGTAGPSTAPAGAATAHELDVVSLAVRDVRAARTPAQVADALARHAMALSGAAGAIVYLGRDGADGYAALGRHGALDPDAPDRLPAARGSGQGPAAVAGRRASPNGEPVDGERPGPPADGPDGRRVVELPIGSAATTFGMLHLVGGSNGAEPQPGPLVSVIVQVAADALERVRLQASGRIAEAEAAAAVGRVATLAHLAAELVGAMKVDDVARTLVDLAVDDLAAGFAMLHVPDPASGSFRLVHARGYPAGLLAAAQTIEPEAMTPVTRAALEGALVDTVGDEGWRAAFPHASNVPAITGVRAITAIPMRVGAVVHGVLTIGWRTAADRSRADRDLLASAADQGAQGLERAILHAHDEDARRFQEAFIGVVSHELRTPITTILAGSRLLRRRLDADPRAAELGDDIEAEANRLTRIVDDLLVLSRLERRHLTTGDEPVHLDHLLARVVRSEATRWPEHRIELAPSTGSHVVIGDETYVEQVARNLISNAAKYSPRGSRVEIAIDDAPDGDVHVRVLDEGPGVAPSEVDDLFSLFYRSPATAASAAGAGIGLFVSRRLVAEMGGRMWAEPRPTAGSEFGFSLSCYPLDESDDEIDLDGGGPDPALAAAD